MPEETPKPAQPAAAQAAPAAEPKAEQKAEAKRPKIPAAQKHTRTTAKKHMANKSSKSATKSFISRAEDLIADNKMDEAKAAVITAISSLDKAAEKGIIHANNAARRKSRLMKKLNSTGKAG